MPLLNQANNLPFKKNNIKFSEMYHYKIVSPIDIIIILLRLATLGMKHSSNLIKWMVPIKLFH